jgi:hypothetical protein
MADLIFGAGPYDTFKTFQSQANDTNQGIAVITPVDSAHTAIDSGARNLSTKQLQWLILQHATPGTTVIGCLRVAAVSPVSMFAYSLSVTDAAGTMNVCVHLSCSEAREHRVLDLAGRGVPSAISSGHRLFCWSKDSRLGLDSRIGAGVRGYMILWRRAAANHVPDSRPSCQIWNCSRMKTYLL